jgi:ribosomal protein S18 acetylase RimI-like enzyme
MPDGAALRTAAAADAGAIRDLTRSAYARWVPVIGREPRPMTIDYDEAVRANRFDLMEQGGSLVALIETQAHPDHLLIVNVAVAPGLQGQGVGSRLMAHAEQLAAELGLGELRLYTNGLMAENLRLYARLGYRVDREEPFMGGITVYMSKLLSPSLPVNRP